MRKIIRLEWLKLRKYRPFWILGLLLCIAILGLGLSAHSFVDMLTEDGMNFNGITPAMLPLFDFVDIWQNLTWFGRFVLPLPAFILVLSVANDYSFRTLKQGVIDGLSPAEWLASKLILVLILTLISTLLFLIVGLYLGFQYSPVTSLDFILIKIEFLGAYALQSFLFLCFALFVTILVRKSIVSFAIVLLWYFPIELLLREFLRYKLDWDLNWMPMKSITGLIDLPFPKYIFMEVESSVDSWNAFKAILYSIGFVILSFITLKKRDF